MRATLPIRHPAVRILAVAGLLALALVGVALREEHARRTGVDVRLAMEAVDPRDLLTGHYVALRLDQTLPENQPCPPGLGDTAKWIALSPAVGGHRVTGGGRTRAEARRLAPVVVRGEAYCDGRLRMNGRESLSLDIGVRRFHIAQREAEAMERALRDRSAAPSFAVVSVGADGKARLKGVIVGGVRSDLSWL